MWLTEPRLENNSDNGYKETSRVNWDAGMERGSSRRPPDETRGKKTSAMTYIYRQLVDQIDQNDLDEWESTERSQKRLTLKPSLDCTKVGKGASLAYLDDKPDML